MRLFIHVDLCTEQYYKPHVSLDRKQYVFCSVCHQCRGCFVVCRKVLISVVNTVSLENLITFVDSKPKHFHLSRDWILSSLALMYYFIYLNFSPSNSSSCKADFTPQMYQIWEYCLGTDPPHFHLSNHYLLSFSSIQFNPPPLLSTLKERTWVRACPVSCQIAF